MTIHTLNAYLDAESDLYLYDDAPKGVFKEPLVRSTTDAITQILVSAALWDSCSDRPERVTLRFTTEPESCLFMQMKPLPIVTLEHAPERDPDSEFHLYTVTGLAPESFKDEMDFMEAMGDHLLVELCEHLLDYFPTDPPYRFFCQVSLAEPAAEPKSAPSAVPA